MHPVATTRYFAIITAADGHQHVRKLFANHVLSFRRALSLSLWLDFCTSLSWRAFTHLVLSDTPVLSVSFLFCSDPSSCPIASSALSAAWSAVPSLLPKRHNPAQTPLPQLGGDAACPGHQMPAPPRAIMYMWLLKNSQVTLVEFPQLYNILNFFLVTVRV